MSEQRDLDKAAQRGEPSYVWRAGQQRRLAMIVNLTTITDMCGFFLLLGTASLLLPQLAGG